MTHQIVDIAFLVEKTSAQLDRAIDLVQQHSNDFNLHVRVEPEINIAEARQKAMKEISGRYICFLDYDAEVTSGWLSTMCDAFKLGQSVGIVYGNELWGSDLLSGMRGSELPIIVENGPAACMLVDKEKIPASVLWDSKIGLKNGWLGGDVEEYDYAIRAGLVGVKKALSSAVFNHVCRKSMAEFSETDRCKTYHTMVNLLHAKYSTAPKDEDWFNDLKYVKAKSDDDCMLASGQSLRKCYHDVISRNGLQANRHFCEMGLT